jgi:drug/metabolite transporter (DMT)-like permease
VNLTKGALSSEGTKYLLACKERRQILELGLSIACGLLTATGFGTADFIAKLSTTKVGFLRTALLMQAIGGALLLPFAIPDSSRLLLQPWAALGGILLGVINALAAIALYKGFEVGRLSVVSPVASCSPVVSVLLAVFFLGEILSIERVVGICIVMIGIILVSIQTTHDDQSRAWGRGVAYGLLFMVLGGSVIFLLKPLSHLLGVFVPVLLMRWTGVPVIALAFFAWKPKGAIRLNALSFIFAVAVFDTFANVIYNVGVSVGVVSIVATVGGLFSTVTVLLAWAVLKERLTRHQVLGFAGIVAGIVILGLFG